MEAEMWRRLCYQRLQASVLVWASDFLEGSTDDAKERLEDLQQSTTSCGVPSVSVESKKLLAELVGVRALSRHVSLPIRFSLPCIRSLLHLYSQSLIASASVSVRLHIQSGS